MKNQYGDLIILKDNGYFISKSGHRAKKVTVKCKCGNIKDVRLNDLRTGKIVSCGCKAKRRTHGMKGTRIYSIWQGIKDRILNKNNSRFHYYGGRGITLCREWESFEPFYEWAMANGYTDKLSIDRKDNNKGYYPENCRWATGVQQANNKRMYKTNSSGHNGVCIHKASGKYQATFQHNHKKHYLGLYDTVEDAGKAVDENKIQVITAERKGL